MDSRSISVRIEESERWGANQDRIDRTLTSPKNDTAGSRWRWLAGCSTYDTDLFFPPENERLACRVKREATAKRICGKCPVIDWCRAEDLINQECFGVWGGLSERDRSESSDAAGVLLEA